MSLLGTIGATLTLPGVAGIVLTIGMAVDANVLIFERIKEEFNRNTKVLLAVKNGFDKALSTILDANITTLIAALLLFIFGSGPIKGFAITLSLGILASMFTAIIFTNFLIHLWFSISKNKEINF
jgi:preprotein translocase subunit SecD